MQLAGVQNDEQEEAALQQPEPRQLTAPQLVPQAEALQAETRQSEQSEEAGQDEGKPQRRLFAA